MGNCGDPAPPSPSGGEAGEEDCHSSRQHQFLQLMRQHSRYRQQAEYDNDSLRVVQSLARADLRGAPRGTAQPLTVRSPRLAARLEALGLGSLDGLRRAFGDGNIELGRHKSFEAEARTFTVNVAEWIDAMRAPKLEPALAHELQLGEHGGRMFFLDRPKLCRHVAAAFADVLPTGFRPDPGCNGYPTLWVGRKRMYALHVDFVLGSLLFHLEGRKVLRLYPPAQSELLYLFRPADDENWEAVTRMGATPFTDWANLTEEEQAAFPLFARATPVDILLQPGDAIFLPCGYAHAVLYADDKAAMSIGMTIRPEGWSHHMSDLWSPVDCSSWGGPPPLGGSTRSSGDKDVTSSLSLPQQFLRRAATSPDAPLLLDSKDMSRGWTYGRVRLAAGGLGALLCEADAACAARPAARVAAVFGDRNPLSYVALLAGWLAPCRVLTLAPLNPWATAAELERLLLLAQPTTLVLTSLSHRQVDALQELRPGATRSIRTVVELQRVPRTILPTIPRMLFDLSVTDEQPPALVDAAGGRVDGNGEAIALLLFASGSTAAPKPVMIPHASYATVPALFCETPARKAVQVGGHVGRRLRVLPRRGVMWLRRRCRCTGMWRTTTSAWRCRSPPVHCWSCRTTYLIGRMSCGLRWRGTERPSCSERPARSIVC